MLDVVRYRGALLGVLVGDVLGVPFEGHRGVVPASELALVLADDATCTLRYSDDTAMTMALAESLLRAGGLDDGDLARAFARHRVSGPERGYSTRTARLLAALDAGTPWSDVAVARHGLPARASNGAAMRVTPVVLYVEAAVEIARRGATRRRPLRRHGRHRVGRPCPRRRHRHHRGDVRRSRRRAARRASDPQAMG